MYHDNVNVMRDVNRIEPYLQFKLCISQDVFKKKQATNVAKNTNRTVMTACVHISKKHMEHVATHL